MTPPPRTEYRGERICSRTKWQGMRTTQRLYAVPDFSTCVDQTRFCGMDAGTGVAVRDHGPVSAFVSDWSGGDSAFCTVRFRGCGLWSLCHRNILPEKIKPFHTAGFDRGDARICFRHMGLCPVPSFRFSLRLPQPPTPVTDAFGSSAVRPKSETDRYRTPGDQWAVRHRCYA